MSSSNWFFFTYIQVSQETSKGVWYSHLFKNFPQFVVIHIVSEEEVDGILLLFLWSMDVSNLISGSFAFSKSSLHVCSFLVHILLKPSLKDFEHDLASKWNECNCAVVWTFFGIALLWDWNKNWPFPVLWPLPSFPNLLAYWGQHLTASSRIWNSSAWIPSPPLALFEVMLPKAHLTWHSRMFGSRWVWVITYL